MRARRGGGACNREGETAAVSCPHKSTPTANNGPTRAPEEIPAWKLSVIRWPLYLLTVGPNSAISLSSRQPAEVQDRVPLFRTE